MSNTLDKLSEHVVGLNKAQAERKTYLNQVKENIERLQLEAKHVETQITEFTGGIVAYNESIRLLKEESGEVSPSLQAVPDVETAEVAEVVEDAPECKEGAQA